MMSSGQQAPNVFNFFKWQRGEPSSSSLTTGLLHNVSHEIELSNYGGVPSPGSESPSGLLNGESLNVQPIADLDLFFERLYSYYRDKGLWCIIVKWAVELLSLGFIICFSGFFLLYVDWHGLKNAKCGMDAVESGTKPCDLVKEAIHLHPLTPFTLTTAIIVGYLALFSVYWIFCFLRFFAQLKDTLDFRHFYYNSLHVTDKEILTMPWETVLEKVVQLQSSQCLCVVKDLSAHDIVMRLMRKENYLIGMLNKGLLSFPISHWIPGAGPVAKSAPDGTRYHLVLTKTLEWTLNWCILQSMFDCFQSSYPSWESDSLGKQFLSNLRTFRDQKLRELNTRHSCSSPSRAWRESPILRNSTSTPLYRDLSRNPHARGNHADSMFLIDSDQRNHPYLLDWYYTSQSHNRTDHHPVERENEILTANQNSGDCWPPNLGIRGDDMEATTSGQFFRESILRQHHPEGEENFGNHHPLDGRSQWWGRGDRSPTGPSHPATADSFIEPPDFINHYTTRNLLDSAWSRRSIGEEEDEEEGLDWGENARRKLSRTTFMDDDDDIEAGIDLHFDDVYSSRPQETSTSRTSLG
ncbi:unnamed protein product [Microthlaspi erraticum]|uniref:Autophagy-related protein 9 n=1 Tax=Microthlaspi erraticum TaxID=1685480 RepID=A0A6D2JW77_9BRAS|nr:unnamed protein product [Microthlaspi erraticum]